MSSRKPFERLSKNVLPSNYALTFKPFLDKFTFDGKADISLKTQMKTNSITLNSLDIDISEVNFSSDKINIKDGIKIDYNKENETATFTFPMEIPEGPGVLSLKYVGQLNDKLKGFYRSKYVHPSGEERYSAVTQFEPTDARLAFPCWDEPAHKATFDITMIVPVDRVALSNMPVIKEELVDEGSWKKLHFSRTPIMSTYLLAMVVGEYDYIEDTDSNGVLIRVYTPLGKKQQGSFALSVAKKTLPFYNSYFNIAYPLPKLDLIAIPDFAAGAMENWGLVTYREPALLVDDSKSSTSTKQRVALVVGHEIAHQWFGNLVTMEWWTHLWLNEGFASWIEYLCVDYCFPEFDIWTQFVSQTLTDALDLDALKNSHPIEVPVGHPSEIDEIFDSISYSKGASIIRMLHDYIGDKDFKKGIHLYLNRHQYNNTQTEDLWAALEEVSKKPINDIMSSWTRQMGYPVIMVEEVVNGNKRSLKVSQQRFIADGSSDEEGNEWLVPASVSTSTGIKNMVINNKTDTIEINEEDPKFHLRLNVGAVGFYRVHYSPSLLEKLLPHIANNTIPPIDRLTIQDDLFALSGAGLANAVDVLKVAASYSNEKDFTVWTSLNTNLRRLLVIYQNTDFIEPFNKFLIQLFTPIMKHVGWDVKESEGPLETMLRSMVISRLGKCGDELVIAEAKKRFQQLTGNNPNICGDLKKAVYSIVLKYGGKEDLDLFIKMYKEADMQEEKTRILGSLGSVSTPELISKVLSFSIGPDVRSQDTVLGLVGVTGSVLGRKMAWEFVKNNWKTLYDKYQGGFLLIRLIKHTTEDFADQEYYDDVESFFKTTPCPAAERSIKQSLERIRFNIQQLERDSDQVREFLKA